MATMLYNEMGSKLNVPNLLVT